MRDELDARVVREALRTLSPRDSGAVAAVIDPLASSAAAGSVEALDLLIWAIDELGLARPAIRRILVDDADVDEVAQDVLVAIAETVSAYRGEARFTTWLYQVARFKAIAHLRRTRPTVPLDGVDGAGGAGGDDPTGDARRISSLIATRASVRQILDTLPDAYRAPLVLRDMDQLPYDEVARQLGLNVNTAKTRVARGRAMVAARMAV